MRALRTPAEVRGFPAIAQGEYRVHLIDVSTGLAVLIQGADFNMLYDGGSADDWRGITASGKNS